VITAPYANTSEKSYTQNGALRKCPDLEKNNLFYSGFAELLYDMWKMGK